MIIGGKIYTYRGDIGTAGAWLEDRWELGCNEESGHISIVFPPVRAVMFQISLRPSESLLVWYIVLATGGQVQPDPKIMLGNHAYLPAKTAYTSGKNYRQVTGKQNPLKGRSLWVPTYSRIVE